MQYALKNTAGYLTALEDYFGTPYPYEKLDLIAVPESFGGAMENVGAITYDEYSMLMDENAPLDQRRSYATVHAHEMSHMWFGDLVTPAWWNDIWLNESFASWMENKAAHAYWPEGEFDRETLKGALGAMANDSLASARADSRADRQQRQDRQRIRRHHLRERRRRARHAGTLHRRGGIPDGCPPASGAACGWHGDGGGFHRLDRQGLAPPGRRGSFQVVHRASRASHWSRPGSNASDWRKARASTCDQARYAPLGSSIQPAAANGIFRFAQS